MTLIGKGWFCPVCEALISDKRYGSKLVTCDCYEKGSNICMAESKKYNTDPETKINWYNLIEKTQEKWKRLYMKIDEDSSDPAIDKNPEIGNNSYNPQTSTPNTILASLKKRART